MCISCVLATTIRRSRSGEDEDDVLATLRLHVGRVFALVERWPFRLAVGRGTGCWGWRTGDGPGGGPEVAPGRAGGAGDGGREGELTHQADRDVGARPDVLWDAG
jgi:hypothetical protein